LSLHGLRKTGRRSYRPHTKYGGEQTYGKKAMKGENPVTRKAEPICFIWGRITKNPKEGKNGGRQKKEIYE